MASPPTEEQRIAYVLDVLLSFGSTEAGLTRLIYALQDQGVDLADSVKIARPWHRDYALQNDDGSIHTSLSRAPLVPARPLVASVESALDGSWTSQCVGETEPTRHTDLIDALRAADARLADKGWLFLTPKEEE